MSRSSRFRLVAFVAFGVLGIARVDAASTPARAPDSAAPVVVFDALCRALQENYPMLEYAGWSDEWIREFRTRVAGAADRRAAFEIMDQLVCRLNDYHTRFSWPGKPSTVSPPLRILPVTTQAERLPNGIWGQWRPPHEMPALPDLTLAISFAAETTGARQGDVVLEVDGEPVQARLARAWPHAVGVSVASKLRSASSQMLRGEPDSALRLRVRRMVGTAEQTIALEIRRQASPAEALLSSSEVEGAPLLQITRWSNDRGVDLVQGFDAWLEKNRHQPALIVDVRGNGGGDDGLAEKVIGRFIKTPVLASISLRRVVPTLNFERVMKFVEPRGPWRYEGRVVVLTDEGCMSATEHFVSGMVEAGALLCGTPTSGACGLIRPVDLPGSAKVNVSRTIPIHSGGILAPMQGMSPHLWEPPALSDLRAGRDTALRAALAWIGSGAPLPPWMQPAAPLTGR